jgi:hypothetical protein
MAVSDTSSDASPKDHTLPWLCDACASACASSPPFRKGEFVGDVRVVGRRDGLDGRTGTTRKWTRATGRYSVVLDATLSEPALIVALEPKNLEPVRLLRPRAHATTACTPHIARSARLMPPAHRHPRRRRCAVPLGQGHDHIFRDHAQR